MKPGLSSSLSRRTFVVAAALAAGVAIPIGSSAQSELDAIPEGALRDHAAWFIRVLGDPEYDLSEGEVAEHFSSAFLAQVPADQVMMTVEQLQPLLGEITIGRIAKASDETQAGIQLIGDTGVRMFLTLWIDPGDGLISGMLIEPEKVEATPLATASASAMASPVVVARIPGMDEILPAYEDARDQLLSQGRDLVEALLVGDEAATESHIGPNALALPGETFVGDFLVLLDNLQTNIVHMEFPEVGAVFDGHVGGGEASGFFHQGGPAFFALTAEEPQAGEVPNGLWKGRIDAGGGQLPIEVDFSGQADAFKASLSIPSQNLYDHPLTNVEFEQERPIGDLSQERALPMGQATNNHSYSAAYAWGASELVISASFDGDGLVTGLNIVTSPPLPPDPAARFVPVAEYQLPFEGTWMVIWGGDTEFLNYHAPVPVQRHAYDLVVWNDGATYIGDGTENGQYHAWGQQVLAPSIGTVVEVLDGLEDLAPNMISDPTRAAGIDPSMHPAGNHVIIQAEEGEYLLIAHFQQGTIKVSEGDQVRTGDVLGLVGSSGNSSEPHIHIHLQDRPDFFGSKTIGLPLAFTNYIASGEPVASGLLRQGELIASAD